MLNHGFHEGNWSLPLAAWQAVVRQLLPEDVLTARLVCQPWSKDLSFFIPAVKAVPCQLVVVEATAAGAPRASRRLRSSSGSITCHHSSSKRLIATSSCADPACSSAAKRLQEASTHHAEEATEPGASAQPAAGQPDACLECTPLQACTAQELLQVFPHCHTVYVDVSNSQQQQLAAVVLNSFMGSPQHSAEQGNAPLDAAFAPDSPAPADGHAGRCGSAVTAGAAAVELQEDPGPQEEQQCQVVAGGQGCRVLPRVWLAAVPRSFHCRARQDCPCAPAGAGGALFRLLQSLPRQLSPSSLSVLHCLELDVFPDRPGDWCLLAHLPCLRQLLLPPFKPALPHEHLPALAQLTQLTGLTVSVQGNVTSWRGCCESFSSVRHLTGLRQLSMHAFHCPGRSLAAALTCLVSLTALRLSGRVVLQPLKALAQLTGLRVLEVTQDMQFAVLCELYQAMPQLTQLAVGRVTPPAQHHQRSLPQAVAAAAAAMAAAELNHWPLPAADADAAPVLVAAAAPPQPPLPLPVPPLPQQPAPAVAAAAAVVPAAGGHPMPPLDSDSESDSEDGDDAIPELGTGSDSEADEPEEGQQQQQQLGLNAMPAAAALADNDGGGGGEVMLEDVGVIVDGLVGNLQGDGIPVHLQHIIERFESIIQLDLTRAASSSPWAWPTGGCDLLREAQGWSNWQQEEPFTGSCDAAGGAQGVAGSSSGGLSRQWGQRGGGGGMLGTGSGVGLQRLELALLRPSDLGRLVELPAEMRSTQHLGLRLRDQLLAFASVCALKMQPGQLAPLGLCFDSLASLSLSGKVALDGQLLQELTAALSGSTARRGTRSSARGASSSSEGAGSSSRGSSRGGNRARQLQSLCLDVHFVGVSAADVRGALAALTELKVLSLRHRGAGKLMLPVSALPSSLTILALKKVLLYCSTQAPDTPSRRCCASPDGSSSTTGGSSSRRSGVEQSLLQVELPSLSAGGGVNTSHAITSPGFTRAVLTHSISAPDISALGPQDTSTAAAASAAGAATCGGGGGACTSCGAAGSCGGVCTSVCEGCVVPLLPRLRRLYLKLCLLPADALTALVGSQAHNCPADIPIVQEGQQPVVQHLRQGEAVCWCSSRGGKGGQGWDAVEACGGVCVGGEGVSVSDGSGGQCSLEVLSVTSDAGEQCEGWGRWLAALSRLHALQVLELAVPEQLGSPLPPELLSVLQSLPRLSHLHLTTSHTPSHLAALSALTALRTLSLNYTGPPALPPSLLQELQAGLGPYCRVQLWEQVVMQQRGSFGEEDGVNGGQEGDGREGAGDTAGQRGLRGVGGPRALLRRAVGVLKMQGVVGGVVRAVGGGWLVFGVGRRLGWLAGSLKDHARR